jgi:hypothetical protein
MTFLIKISSSCVATAPVEKIPNQAEKRWAHSVCMDPHKGKETLEEPQIFVLAPAPFSSSICPAGNSVGGEQADGARMGGKRKIRPGSIAASTMNPG